MSSFMDVPGVKPGDLDAKVAAEIADPTSATRAAGNATYVNKPSGIADGQVPVWQASTSTFVPGSGGGGAPSTLDGGNATSVYTGTFNFDGGSAT